VTDKEIPPGVTFRAEQRRSRVSRCVDGGEELIYVIVAGLLLIAAAATCGFGAIRAVQQFLGAKPLEGIFSLLNDLLLVLIITEVLRTVARFLRKRELNVDVEDLIPFLVIGAISAARRILAIGANLSLNEATLAERQGGTVALTVDWDRFHQAIIELGVNVGLILALTLALLIIHRYTSERREVKPANSRKSE